MAEHDKTIEVIYRKLRPAAESGGRFPPVEPGVSVANGIVVERDCPVRMRDGTILYTDIYRPEGGTRLPAIVSWSPYGKRESYNGLNPNVAATLPPGTVSCMAKGEGPDPAYWCHYGYAVINPDARGAGHSEGHVVFHGRMEGRDIHDLVEWVAARDWCNGKLGMAGNSWPAVAQWFGAAEKPPHLAALAPWEALSDFYRQFLCPGGIPEIGFNGYLRGAFFGPNCIEDIVAMFERYPFMNEYWEDKIGRFEQIDIPTYVVASWTHFHTLGSLEAFRKIAGRAKWLRVHNTFEWPDAYNPDNLEDLRRFFDRYLKGIHNGWELTPAVRLTVLDPGGVDQVNRPEKEFPLARTQHTKLHLDGASGTLAAQPPPRASSVSYDSEQRSGLARFVIRFEEATELTGYLKLRLWVQAETADDMDLFVYVRKLDKDSRFVPFMLLGKPHPGAQGWLRVSRRELDESRSTPAEPFLAMRRELRLTPGEIVPVEVGIWPTSMLWHAGEQLELIVSGQFQRDPQWFEPFKFDVRNRGAHVIHTGGKFDSHLLVPRIPRPQD